MARTIRIRGVDDTTYAALHLQAAAARLSLSAYLKRELVRSADEPATAAGPSMAELLARADRRRRHGITVDGADIVAAVRELREENGDVAGVDSDMASPSRRDDRLGAPDSGGHESMASWLAKATRHDRDMPSEAIIEAIRDTRGASD